MDGIAFILALIALIAAFGARRRATALQARLAAVLDELQALRTQVAALRLAFPEAPRAEAAPAAEVASASPPPEAERAAAPTEAPGEAPRADAPIPTPPAEAETSAAAGEPPEAEAPIPAGTPEPTVTPAQPAAPPAALPAPATAAAPSLEERLGTRWAVWLGGLALALGGVLLVRYSIEQGLFGAEVRVVLGAVFALVLIAAGEWFRRSERASPVQGIPSAHIPGILTAAGTISAFGTVYAAHALYMFIDPATAFVLLGAIGVATMLAAALHGPALAGLGLAGAFAVPLMVTSQQPSPWPVVLYLATVAASAYALARLRRWLWLACAAVAGAMAWGLALLDPVSSGAAGPWALALVVHVGVQLALAAAFIAVAPHRTTADADAEPDWIATFALAALAALAIRTLQAPMLHEQWLGFAVAALAILGVTAWLSAPAASAAVLAGIVALAAVVLWPGLAAPPELPPPASVLTLPSAARLLPAALAGMLLRLPNDVTGFLTFAALSTLALGALATLRLWRSRTLPMTAVGLYTLAAVVPALLALVLAYLRVTQFDRSIPFALIAVALAAIFYVVADLLDRSAPRDTRTAGQVAGMSLVIGAFASGVAAAMALAFTMALDRGYLTVAFAITAFTTAIFAVVDRITMLRYVVVAVGLIVLGRLAWDPRIMGADVGSWPIINWLLIGYGVPAAAFLGAGFLLKREGEDLAVRLCDALGVLLAALLVYFQIRHALNGGDPFAPTSGQIEQGLFALMSIAFAAVLIRLDVARANPVFRAASLIFGVVSAAVIAVGLGLVENPLLTGEPVRGPVVFSTLLLAYLLPGLAAIVLHRLARGVRPAWYVSGAAGLGVALLFGYATLELRHIFHGEQILIDRGSSAPEVGLLALISIAFAIVLVWLDRPGADPVLRSASLAFGVIAAAQIAVGLGLGENPLLTGEPVRGPVVFSALLAAYLLPGLAAILLNRLAGGARPAWYVNGAATLGFALLFGYAALELRHAFHGELVLVDQGSTAPEVGLLALIAIAFAIVLIRLDRAGADPVLRTASLAFGVVAAALIAIGLGQVENPLFTGDPVRGPVVLSSLLPAYLVPGIAAVALVRLARGVRPDWYVTGGAALALALVFGYVTLEVRHAFQGETLSIGRGASAPEVWSYSVAWLALGVAFLLYGLWRGVIEPRLASAALVVLSVLKVFLYDLTGIGGFWRAFSVICLGFVLIGIGLIYQKLVFARPLAPPPGT